MSIVKGSEQLANINQKVIDEGQILPSVKLKDGTTVQKLKWDFLTYFQ